MTNELEYQIHVLVYTGDTAPVFLDVCGNLLIDDGRSERHFDDRAMDECFACTVESERPEQKKCRIDVVGDWPYWRVQMSSKVRHILFSVDAKQLDELAWGPEVPSDEEGTMQTVAPVLSVDKELYIHVLKKIKKNKTKEKRGKL